VRQVVNWVEGLANGKVGHRQKLIQSRFVGGESISPARQE